MLNFMTEQALLGRDASELRPDLRTQTRLLNGEGLGSRSVDNWRHLLHQGCGCGMRWSL